MNFYIPISNETKWRPERKILLCTKCENIAMASCGLFSKGSGWKLALPCGVVGAGGTFKMGTEGPEW